MADFPPVGRVARGSSSGISTNQATALFNTLNLNTIESKLNNLIPVFGSENGFLFDVSDLNTLFQDNEGLIPVTNLGQPVGLILDKSGNGNNLTLFNAVLSKSFDKYCIVFNGIDSYGALPKDILNGAESLFVNINIEMSNVNDNNFPLFASISNTSNVTRFGMGIFNNQGLIEVFSRTGDTSSNTRLGLGTIENNIPYSISANIDYIGQTIDTYYNNQLQSSESDYTDGNPIDDQDATDFDIGRGVARNLFFMGKMFSCMLITKKLEGFELELVNTTMNESLPKKQFNTFLVAGQSNTDGRVSGQQGDFYLHNNLVNEVNVWNGTDVVPYNLTDFGQNGNGSSWVTQQSNGNYSFAHVALKNIAESTPNVLVCQVTSGGTSIHPVSFPRGCWNANYNSIPSGTPRLLEELENRFTSLSTYCNDNGITLNVLGLLWHQGEADSGYTNAPENYLTNYSDLINRVRDFTNSPRLPVFYGTINTSSTQFNSTIQQAQLSFADNDVDAYCIDNSDTPLLSDNLHFNAEGCNEFGRQITNVILSHYRKL